MAETLSLISTVAFVMAAICLAVAILIFVRFKIPSVIGDLSGRNARKSIEQMRKMNENSGNKSYKPSKVNSERGKLTETMKGDRKNSAIKNQGDEKPETGLLDENKIQIVSDMETALLNDEDATDVLRDDNETVALDADQESAIRPSGGISIEIIEEVMLIHSNEVIP